MNKKNAEESGFYFATEDKLNEIMTIFSSFFKYGQIGEEVDLRMRRPAHNEVAKIREKYSC